MEDPKRWGMGRHDGIGVATNLYATQLLVLAVMLLRSGKAAEYFPMAESLYRAAGVLLG